MKLIMYIVLAIFIKHAYTSYTALQVDDLAIQPILQVQGPETYDANVRLLHGGSMCSGVVIGSNYILTAAHCATEIGRLMTNNPVEVRDIFDRNTDAVGHFVALDHDQDIALLKGDFRAFKRYKLNTSYTPKIGEKLTKCGFPMDGAFTCGDEVFTSSYYQQWYVTGAAMHHGESGGPVFNSTGEVVGVNSAITQEGSILSPATAIDVLFDL